jgi:ABC-type branched-subunit amino acid transport system ATPase component
MPGAMKKAVAKGSVAKTFDAKKLMPKMTPQDKAMLKILQNKYGKDVYKGDAGVKMTAAEKAKFKKALDKIVADSKKKAKAETQKRKAPDSNFIARM